ncbi:hypothetical protein BGW38_001391 [Lunasporangiospora selenospora]|uniref:Clavaminate synthase-like protein n=1 Tax=Lunasporangiospora selenospora TaxID=979761 RepID=A0A9P6FU49_9FUNG|nr:hypothetical protein BGW38_001391 [Lunasporangiospora selenospora]
MSSSSPLAIPTIDISALLDATAPSAHKNQVATALLEAFSTFGVFYITSPHHPVFASHKVDHILKASTDLFALDPHAKNQIPKIEPGGFTRGYVPIGGESGSATKELKEGFSYGYEWDPALLTQRQKDASLNNLQGPNSWPQDSALAQLDSGKTDGFKSTLQEFYLNVCQVAHSLLKGIALALDLPEDELVKYCGTSETISFMRLFHYLPYADQAHTSLIGSRLVVNGGDYLSLLTGGKFISPLHRVVSNGQEERYSMCCFYYPDYDAKIPLLVKDKVEGQAASGSYSLLRDQREDSAKDNNNNNNNQQSSDDSQLSDPRVIAAKLLNGEINFGDYIVSKWTQVYRKGGAY